MFNLGFFYCGKMDKQARRFSPFSACSRSALSESWCRAAIASVRSQGLFTHLGQTLFPLKQQHSIPSPSAFALPLVSAVVQGLSFRVWLVLLSTVFPGRVPPLQVSTSRYVSGRRHAVLADTRGFPSGGDCEHAALHVGVGVPNRFLWACTPKQGCWVTCAF